MTIATAACLILFASVCASAQETPVIACNPKAISAEQKPRYAALTKRLRTAARGMQDLPDGYAIRLDSQAITLPEAAEWISMERLCCPFLKFELSTSGNQSEWTLKLTGPAGSKAILEAAFAPASK
jgi:hypothetical protein